MGAPLPIVRGLTMTRKLRPSAAKRWMSCPGSVRLSDGIADSSSKFAEEGTAAHHLGETCLTHNFDAAQYRGHRIAVKDSQAVFIDPADGGERFSSVWEVGDEMIDAVQVYLDTIRSFVEPGDDLMVEQRMSLNEVDDYAGTADALIHKVEARTLVVADLKYGRGVVVDAEDNPQALSYAAMAVQRFHNHAIDRVIVAIIQPRADGEPVRTWEVDTLDLFDWIMELRAAAARTLDPDAPLAAGSWCRFCPAAPICPALAEKVNAEVLADFTPEGQIVLSEPSSFTPERLARILEHATMIEGWVSRVRDYAFALAESGKTIPGYKLVPKRSIRKWDDEDATVSHLLGTMKLPREEVYEEKLKSPTKIEAVIGKKRKNEIAHLVVAVSSGSTLAPEADRRQAVGSDPVVDFA